MRRSGRTTRIANYAIDQLLNCGNVIVTDHYAFESDSSGQSQDNLISMVHDIWNKIYAHEYINTELNVKMHALQGFDKHMRVIHFSLKYKHTIV
jgi:hypothetical protein